MSKSLSNFCIEIRQNFFTSLLHLPTVIVPLIIFGSFLLSDIVDIGIAQFNAGAQKWVLKFIELNYYY